jgi:hypothetical protein
MVYCKQAAPEHRENKCNKIATKNSPQYPLNIGYNDKYIEERVTTKFLGLQIDNHLNWKSHIDHLIPKLNRAYYAVRFMLNISNIDTLKTIFFTYFHYIMKYGQLRGIYITKENCQNLDGCQIP